VLILEPVEIIGDTDRLKFKGNQTH